jgi:CHASE2 domain-containing sensor protein
MKTNLLIVVILLIGCSSRDTSLITIVDIGYLDRSGIAKQLQIINKYSPRVVVLDFMLTTDSLEKDVLITEALANTSNLVQSTILHNYVESKSYWDSLETYHPKFRASAHGFSNITITDDSVIVAELPMRQFYRNNAEPALSFLAAEKSFGATLKFTHDLRDDRHHRFDKAEFTRDFKIISTSDLLNERFKKEDLTDKIVMMGQISKGDDVFYLDRSRTEMITGVEIQANFIMQIIGSH